MPTIGVAIAVPEPWGVELQEMRESFGDTMASSIPTHVTLVPPTEVAGDDLAEVEEHLEAIAASHAPFMIHLLGTGTFRPVSPVVFVAVSEGISNCEVLAGQVRQGPLDQKLSFPYHPHVTVAHDVDEVALDSAFETLKNFECSFVVETFHLYMHGRDGVWRPEHTYRLTG